MLVLTYSRSHVLPVCEGLLGDTWNQFHVYSAENIKWRYIGVLEIAMSSMLQFLL
jgi:hypothetical protein